MTGAEDEVRRRIGERGPITFAEFMEVALYWPDGGYYSTRRAFGTAGDFYTAPLTHPVFGALIARQLGTMWRSVGRPERFLVIEAGAGTGRLAVDIIDHAPALDAGFARALAYLGVERRPAPPSSILPRRRERRPEQAGERASPADGGGGVTGGIEWAKVNGSELPSAGGPGVTLGNELLDAMPVHRVTVEEGGLRELFVGLSPDGRLVETAGAPSTPALAERLASLGVRLSEGHRAEVNLGLRAWVESAFGAIDSGYLLLIDYGHEASDYYDESRRRGTLRCYTGHTLGMNPYINVGRQDISVHVELTSLRAEAAAAGFVEAGATSQAGLLRGLGIDEYRRDIAGRADMSPAVRAANLRQIDSLADPDGMGAFRVLAFAKDAPTAGVLGVASGPPGRAPLSTAEHMPLGAPPQPQSMPTWDELLR